MSTRVNDPRTGAHVIVMQRVHEEDLSGYVLSEGSYEHLCLPARYEGKKHTTVLGWSDPRTGDGELLWPERFDEAAIQKLEIELGPYATAGQLQQRPAPREGSIVKEKWIGHFTSLPKLSQVALFADSAFKTGVSNDPSACGAFGTDGLGNYYLFDLWTDKVEYADLMLALHRFYARVEERHPGLALVIEDKASGQSAIQTLSKPLARLDGPPLPALNVLPFPERRTRDDHYETDLARMDKMARLEHVTPIMQSGHFFVPDDAPWLDRYLDELTQFPAAAHDEMVDITSMALIRLARRVVRQFGAVGGTREPTASGFR